MPHLGVTVESNVANPPNGAAHTPQLIIGCDPAGLITLWSDGFAELLGVSAHRALGTPARTVAAWDCTARDRTACSLLSLGSVWVFPTAVTTRHGHRYHLRTTATAALDGNGREETLYRSVLTRGSTPANAPRRLAPWGARDLIAYCDENAYYSYVSQRIATAFGYAPRDMIGHQPPEFLHPDDHGRFTNTWNQALNSPQRPQQLTLRRARVDGTWTSITTTITNELRTPAITAMVLRSRENSTSPPPASLSADLPRRTLDTFLRATTDGVWIINADGNTEYTNQRLRDLLTLTTDSLLEHIRAVLNRHRTSEQPSGAHHGVHETHDLPLHDGGTPRWIRISIAPRYDHTGHPDGWIILTTDISHQRHTPPGRTRLLPSPADDTPTPPVPTEPVGGPFLIDPGLHTRINDLPLSHRERSIVTALLNGDRVPAIARHHNVSQSTIRNQLASVFRKLHVTSQQELINHFRPRTTTDKNDSAIKESLEP